VDDKSPPDIQLLACAAGQIIQHPPLVSPDYSLTPFRLILIGVLAGSGPAAQPRFALSA
jgi:hypothetical protein